MKKIGIILICLGFLTHSSFAKPRDCHVNYQLDNAGTISTGWIYLGKVKGILANKKKKCKKLAIKYCAKSKQKLLAYAPVGSANMQSLCNKRRLTVYFDTKVEGKRNSKDGYCSTPIKCTRPPCKWTAYAN